MDDRLPKSQANAITRKSGASSSTCHTNDQNTQDQNSERRKRIKLCFRSTSDSATLSPHCVKSSLDKPIDLIRPTLPLSYFTNHLSSNTKPYLPWPSILEPTNPNNNDQIPFPSWIMEGKSTTSAFASPLYYGNEFLPKTPPLRTANLTAQQARLLAGRQSTSPSIMLDEVVADNSGSSAKTPCGKSIITIDDSDSDSDIIIVEKQSGKGYDWEARANDKTNNGNAQQTDDVEVATTDMAPISSAVVTTKQNGKVNDLGDSDSDNDIIMVETQTGKDNDRDMVRSDISSLETRTNDKTNNGNVQQMDDAEVATTDMAPTLSTGTMTKQIGKANDLGDSDSDNDIIMVQTQTGKDNDWDMVRSDISSLEIRTNDKTNNGNAQQMDDVEVATTDMAPTLSTGTMTKQIGKANDLDDMDSDNDVIIVEAQTVKDNGPDSSSQTRNNNTTNNGNAHQTNELATTEVVPTSSAVVTPKIGTTTLGTSKPSAIADSGTDGTERASSPAKAPGRTSSPSQTASDTTTSLAPMKTNTTENQTNQGNNALPPPAPRQLELKTPTSTPSITSNRTTESGGPSTAICNTEHQATDNELGKIAINTLADSEPIYIHPHFAKLLKKHQIDGIRFMWKQVVGEGNGCILAHCMGLGKTLQVVVLVATLFEEMEKGNLAKLGAGVTRILIIAPLITLTNWLNEFDKWLPPDVVSNMSHIFNSADLAGINDNRRVQYVRRWYNEGGVMLMSYDQFRSLLTTSLRKADFEEMLLEPSLVILDEAHRIKDKKAAVTQCVNRIQTPRRICLTGYPVQNNLGEYYCMIDFIYPGLLGDEQSFKTVFKKPIEAIYADSNASDRYLAKEKLLLLQLVTSNIIQRKNANILNQELPGKTEYLISCRLTPLQYKLYLKLLALCKSFSAPVMLSLMLFRCLCNHPAIFKEMLLKSSEKSNYLRRASASVATLSDTSGEVNDQDESATVKKFATKEVRDWNGYDVKGTAIESWEHSHKIRMVLSISRLCKSKKEKLAIVSHSIISLNYIETMLAMNQFIVSRIDGSTPQGQRQSIIDQFNDQKSSEIILLSAKAGGIGVNITGASRMILLDSDWNPSHDEQSIGRIYRFGQKKHVFIYRLYAYSTVESIIMKQGAHKRAISSRVVDNMLSKLQMENELRQYYRVPKENPSCKIKEKTLKKLNDVVLKESLGTQESSVVKVELGGTEIASQRIGQQDGLGGLKLTAKASRNLHQTTKKMLRDAKTQHMRTFTSHGN